MGQLLHYQSLLPQEDVVGRQPVNVDEGVIIAANVRQVAGRSTSLYRFDSYGGHIVWVRLRVTAGRKESVKEPS